MSGHQEYDITVVPAPGPGSAVLRGMTASARGLVIPSTTAPGAMNA